MVTKLTLRIDESLIARAKAYSKASGKSVSQLVADYLEALPRREAARQARQTPVVTSLRGMLRGAEADRKIYRQHLEDK